MVCRNLRNLDKLSGIGIGVYFFEIKGFYIKKVLIAIYTIDSRILLMQTDQNEGPCQ